MHESELSEVATEGEVAKENGRRRVEQRGRVSNGGVAMKRDDLEGSRLVLPLLAIAAVISLAALVGWIVDVPRLREIIPGRVAMEMQTAGLALLMCAGLAARLRGRAALTVAVGALVTLGGVVTIADYLLNGASAQTALGRGPLPGAPQSGRMALQTAVSFVALGVSLFDVSKRRTRVTQIREFAALLAAAIGYVALVGHVFGASPLWIVGTTHIALNGALVILALGVAVLLGPPSATFISEILRRSDGGYVARRLLPLALVLPVAIGWLRLLGEAQGRFDTPYGATILVVTNAALFAVSTWWVARLVNRLARDRATALSELERARVEHEVRAHFIRALAHDLRTPLSTIRAGAERMSRLPSHGPMVGGTNESEGNVDQQRVAEVVVRGVARLDRMITDLLDGERIRAAQGLAVQCTPGDACLIVDRVVDGLALSYDDRIVAKVDRPLEGKWDASALERILENLIGNALKYGDNGVVTVSARALGDAVCFSVHNRGNPIRESEIPRLLEPFQRGSDTGGRTGWGIGLPVVHGLCDALGGHMDVESSDAEGTTFVVTLPRIAPDARGADRETR